MIDAIYTLVDDFLSGFNRFYNLLERMDFDYQYDPYRNESVMSKGNHRFIIDESTASYVGPYGDRPDLSFKEMIRFIRDPKRI